MQIPDTVRILKHKLFGYLPGRVGLRNRACFHHWTKPSALPAFEAALANIKPGDICIDCGANVGVFTKKFADKGAQVYAFEPDPWSFQQLKEAVGHLKNVTLINKAVGTKEGTVHFYRDRSFGDKPTLHSLASSTIERAGREQEKIDVAIIDFIQFLRGIEGDIKMLKMDIEGAEVDILETLTTSDQVSKLSHVFVETHELQYPDLLERTWKLREETKRVPNVSFNLDWH